MRIDRIVLLTTTLLASAGAAAAQGFSKDPMTVVQKFSFFEKPVFGPREAILTSFTAGFRLLTPPDAFPREWRQGMGAYGRNVGDHYARHAARATASFAAAALLHEDVRYHPARSTSFVGRFAYALGYTLVDRTDGGRLTPAISNFAGAMAGGFVGNAYMPDGFHDTTHAGQRALGIMGGMAIKNLAEEFGPDLARIARKLGIPTGGKIPVPEWWTSK